MLARRTASAAASTCLPTAAPLSQFHTSSTDSNEGSPRTPLAPNAESQGREAKMKAYLARQQQEQQLAMPYTGDFQPQAAQYSGLAQRQPRPAQRQSMNFARLAGGVQPEMPQREPQMMRGPAGMYPKGYQPQTPNIRPPSAEFGRNFGRPDFGQHLAGQPVGPVPYRRKFGVQQPSPPNPSGGPVIKKVFAMYDEQERFKQPQQQQQPPMGRQMPMGQQFPGQLGQQQFQQQPPMGGQIPMRQEFTGQPGQQAFQQQPPMPRMNRQGPPRPQVQPGGFRISKHFVNSENQPPQQLHNQQQQQPPDQQQQSPYQQHQQQQALYQQQQQQQQAPYQQRQPGPIANPLETSAWAEAIATTEFSAPRPLKISRARFDNPPQAQGTSQYTPDRTPSAQQQQQQQPPPQPQQTPIPDSPPTREAGSFSFNSAPQTSSNLPGPRAVRRSPGNRPRAVDWNKPRPATPVRTRADRSSKDSKTLRDPPPLRGITYNPAPPTPESLFTDIPETLLSPLGQSRILTAALPAFHKPTEKWAPEDWDKYDRKREMVGLKVLEGRRYVWDWTGEGGVDGVVNGGVALDSVRRLVSKNGSYDVKGKRVMMEFLWERLPRPLVEPPKKLLMLAEGKKEEVRA